MTVGLVASWAAALASLLAIPPAAFSAKLLSPAQALEHLKGEDLGQNAANAPSGRRLRHKCPAAADVQADQKRLLAAHGIVQSSTYNFKSKPVERGMCGSRYKDIDVKRCRHQDAHSENAVGTRGSLRNLKDGDQEIDLNTELDVDGTKVVLVTVDGAQASSAGGASWSGEQLTTGSVVSALSALSSSRQQVIPGAFINSVPGLTRAGKCGNHRCELGELVCS